MIGGRCGDDIKKIATARLAKTASRGRGFAPRNDSVLLDSDPMSRVDADVATRSGGLGLGLALRPCGQGKDQRLCPQLRKSQRQSGLIANLL